MTTHVDRPSIELKRVLQLLLVEASGRGQPREQIELRDCHDQQIGRVHTIAQPVEQRRVCHAHAWIFVDLGSIVLAQPTAALERGCRVKWLRGPGRRFRGCDCELLGRTRDRAGDGRSRLEGVHRPQCPFSGSCGGYLVAVQAGEVVGCHL